MQNAKFTARERSEKRKHCKFSSTADTVPLFVLQRLENNLQLISLERYEFLDNLLMLDWIFSCYEALNTGIVYNHTITKYLLLSVNHVIYYIKCLTSLLVKNEVNLVYIEFLTNMS